MKPQMPPVIGVCGKRVYASKAVGEKLAKRVNDGGRDRVSTYHCTKCHGWHLGASGRHAQARGVRRMKNELDQSAQEAG